MKCVLTAARVFILRGYTVKVEAWKFYISPSSVVNATCKCMTLEEWEAIARVRM